ncbi:EamA family transporter [Spirochaeta cellobiosiphila]|uniref:EamA family transporter n=1 Tax=Spirochaeta cellobiosiphila TaxID=504483 RepID=UPI0004077835|nr:EamA family transporter [Spirochaeta cellobiosiphila]
MFYLLLAIICSIILGHLFKVASKYHVPQSHVFVVNYLVATVTAYLLIRDPFVYSLPVVAMGTFVGVFFVLGFFLFSYNIKLQGVGLASIYMRLSALIPTIGSVILFHEQLGISQVIAIGLIFVGLLFAGSQLPWRNSTKEVRQALLWGIVLFIVVGLSDFSLKLKTELFSHVGSQNFLFYVFGAALLISLVWFVIERKRVTLVGILLGAVVGLFNFGSAQFLLVGLKSIPGMAAYPINGIGVILGSLLSGILIWQEKWYRHNFIFLGASLIGLYLLY